MGCIATALAEYAVKPRNHESKGLAMSIKIGFYICHCGINIAYRVRVEEVA
jgi:hypothetical protein